MKLKIILSVLLLFSLLKVDANPLVDISIASVFRSVEQPKITRNIQA